MKPSIVFASLCLAASLTQAASAQIATASQAQSMPPNLAPQVQKLADLLSDRFAQAYPEATMVQTIPLGAGENIMLVVLTVEGFSGGNNYTQYLAVFKPEAGEKQATHYQLIDTLPVAGKSWRTIEQLQAHAYASSKNRRSRPRYHGAARACG